MRDIQTILGHSSLAMTERYTHVLMDDLRAGIAALSNRQGHIREKSGQPVGNRLTALSSAVGESSQLCA
ncbi:hypothetical protein EPN81_01415 [Patescibacteria group bacterium]|nr:MAG: hypothetical protein EPN81_01415 [Patescibacteria group bacterium]